MSRVLVSELIAESGLDALRDAGHEVDVRLDLSAEELLDAVPGAHALIIRSATQVTAELLDAGTDLVVVGRAGIGLDNVDVAHATHRGVMVVNAPQSNVLSAAEHTMALLLAQARNIPQAHAALVDGRWERKQWEGVELADKTLGIIGLGRIGRLVAQRAAGFGMRVIAHDPFVPDEAATRLGIELVALKALVGSADFVTLHLARTPETMGLIDAELLSHAKPGLRLINVARGGIVDEAAVADAVREGRLGGAAVDVFASEPCTDSPLFGVDGVVVTPHLGASTREAQDKAGATIAEQVQLALAGDFVPFAVNVDAAEASETLKPFLPVAQELGALFAAMVEQLPSALDVEFRGEIGEVDTKLAVLSLLKGMLGQISGEPVSYVNALDVAAERGLELRTISAPSPHSHLNVISVRGGGRSIGGTVSMTHGGSRIIEVDGHNLDIRPSPHMLFVRNDDTPGRVGTVGAARGDAGINISNMHNGQTAEGVAALRVIAPTSEVPTAVQESLRTLRNVLAVRAIDLY